MSIHYDFDVTINAGDLLTMLSATTDLAGRLSDCAGNEPDTKARYELDRRVSRLLAAHKPALKAWCDALCEERGYDN